MRSYPKQTNKQIKIWLKRDLKLYIWNLSLGKKYSVNSGLLFPFSDASSIEANEDMEIAYPITCGESKAILLWKKFVCPGINVKCVKVTVSA